ncbi:MAG: DNA helicase, partial [Treponema sp.]|nr:DNA helicase [Treponema sp.]
MTNVAKDIFRSIHEGKWLNIEYESKDSMRRKYWIAVLGINLEYKSLTVTGLHIGDCTTEELTIYIEKIVSSQVLEGTYYKTNKELLQDIEAFPQKYTSLFSGIANLKTLNYLSDCNKLSDLPKLNTEYELVNRLDSSKIANKIYRLDEEQFKHFVNSFKKRAEIVKSKNKVSIMQLALNVLSVHTNKGLYVLAYR